MALIGIVPRSSRPEVFQEVKSEGQVIDMLQLPIGAGLLEDDA